ncbi:MAG: RluA family pseudouridine synthase [Parvibaculaceae bacterium]
MSGVSHIEVDGGDDGLRVDRWFKRHYPELGHGRLEKLLRKGQVRVDGGRVKANTRLEAGQTIRVPPFGPVSAEAPRKKAKPAFDKKEAAFIQGLVLHMDESIIVLNKPSGLAVQGGSRTERHIDGMLEGLKFDLPERPRLVHRLDRDTSGVLLLARTASAAAKLGKAFKHRQTRKIYWALTVGVPRPENGTIRMMLAKQMGPAGERVVPVDPDTPGAQSSETHFAAVARAGQKLAWVAFMPVTGRTHQLRVHAAEALHCPIVGDGKYGGADAHPGGEIPSALHLHARSIEIAHPDGGRLSISAPLPEHMVKTWDLLGLDQEDDGNPFEELDV